MSLTPEAQRARLRLAVVLLGGAAEAARRIPMRERTLRALCSGQRQLHPRWLRKVSQALIRHAEACRQLERELSPAFIANLTPQQQEAPHA